MKTVFSPADDNNDARLVAALELGEQDVKGGRTQPYTPQLLDQIEENARKHAAQGQKPNPDVCP